ncbi:MAG: hypothetical protein DMG21_04640 [Acidobacteria bacterium]|nr:MAG: hypothetical protein DMG21_04640 [Acidobacteriota bacterium]
MTPTTFLRSGVRLPLELPMEVRWKGRSGKKERAQGKTVTVSGSGFYVILPPRLRLAQATPIQFTMDLPVELTGVPMKLTGQGRVVRGHRSSAEAGVGAIIDDYRFQLSPPEA